MPPSGVTGNAWSWASGPKRASSSSSRPGGRREAVAPAVGVEAREREPVDVVDRPRERHVDHAHAAPGGAEALPDRGLAAIGAVDRAQAVAALVALVEIPDAVAARATPVNIVVQACGVSGCVVERSTPEAPCPSRRSRCGTAPAARSGSSTRGVMASRPMTVRVGEATQPSYRRRSAALPPQPGGVWLDERRYRPAATPP